jgi:hypothetical protein
VTPPHEPLSKRNTRLVVCNKQRLFQKDFEWFETLLSIMKWKERKEGLTFWTVREARRHVKKRRGRRTKSHYQRIGKDDHYSQHLPISASTNVITKKYLLNVYFYSLQVLPYHTPHELSKSPHTLTKALQSTPTIHLHFPPPSHSGH